MKIEPIIPDPELNTPYIYRASLNYPAHFIIAYGRTHFEALAAALAKLADTMAGI